MNPHKEQARMRLFFVQAPHGRGAAGYKIGATRKSAGVIVFYDFLNSPAANFLGGFFIGKKASKGDLHEKS
ncbi:MAG: hypothetical protein LBT45_02230 [Rickettsiales bacterium]|nr:hypothetical protein [Rickettsiales bacterium]